jgi:hypothetical protein
MLQRKHHCGEVGFHVIAAKGAECSDALQQKIVFGFVAHG